MSSSGLFYAYAKNISTDWSYRYLITFATRDVADIWWRAVTESVVSGYQTFAAVSRVTPQFYTHNPAVGNIMNTINDARVALHLRGQMFFTLVSDRDGRDLSVAPPVPNYTDHISGGRYYIRSSQQPDTYWYYDTSSRLIRASRTQRTKFIISIAEGNNLAGKVMIGTDDILITLISGTSIGIDNSANQLGSSSGPFPFRFSEFIDDFQITYDNATGNLGPIARNVNAGERWELA